MHGWFEGEPRQNAGRDVDQAEGGMIDHDVAAAFGAIAADAHLAALEFA